MIELKSIGKTVSVNVTLPDGEYLFWVYQARDGNEELDLNILEIPEEPVGLGN